MLFVGANVVLLHMWGDAHRPWLQGMHGMYGIGSILGPLLAEPFLLEVDTLVNTTKISPSANLSVIYMDTTQNIQHVLNTSLVNTSTIHEDIRTVTDSPDEQSQIWCAYTTASVLAGMCTFILLYMFEYTKRSPHLYDNSQKATVGFLPSHLQGSTPYLIIGGDFVFMFCYGITWTTWSTFLMIYVSGHLRWTKASSANLMSVFFVAFTVPRAWNIAIARLITPSAYLWFHVILSTISIPPLIFLVHYHTAVIWVSSIFFAIGLSGLCTCNVTWVDHTFGMTSKMGSAFYFVMNLGYTTSPALVGLLLGTLGEEAILYLVQGSTILLITSLAVTQCLARQLGMKNNKEPCSQRKVFVEST